VSLLPRPDEHRSLFPRHFPPAALTVLVIAAGCGSGSRHAETVQSAPPVTVTITAPTKSEATTTAHTAPPRSEPKSEPGFAWCSGFVKALVKTTSCDFANNVFWTFYEARPEQVFPVYSPASGKSYEVTCSGDLVVMCTGGAGAKVRFPLSAVETYTERQATAYANSHDLGLEQPAQPQTTEGSPPPPPPSSEGCGQPGVRCNNEGMNMDSPYFKELCRQLYAEWKTSVDLTTGGPSAAGRAAIQRYGQLLCDQ